MPSLSRRVLGLQESAIRKLDLTVREQRGVRFHRLNIGQPDVPTPQAMLDAVARWQPEVMAYGPASGLPALRDAAADYHSRWSPGLAGHHVAVTTGGSEALQFAFAALCDPGDELLVPEPYYTNYNGFAALVSARVRPIPTRIEDDFALPDDTVLDSLVTDRTRAVVFSNPANPTGAIYPRQELERLAAWAERHNLFVVADEVYRRIWFDEPPPSALELNDAQERVICVDSFSKTFSACGLRLGFLISRNTELMERVERLGQARLGTQPLAQAVGLAALELPDGYYTDVRELYRQRVQALQAALAQVPGVSASEPQGAFYCMARLPVVDSEHFARWLVTDFRHDGQSVVVAPGPGFYADPARGRQEVRLAAVNEAPVLRHAVALLGRALVAYAQR